MARSSPSEIIFVSVNHSITLIGKVWLIVMIFLRLLLLLLAGYPLYQDEQERFVCNTIQPGCANVCYDLFSPVSLFRFWLVQLITLSLPYIIFTIYVIHKVSNDLNVSTSASGPGEMEQLYRFHQELYTNTSGKIISQVHRGSNQCFSGAYILQLIFRTLLEAGFGAAHYYLFGFYIPRRFLCQHSPCTTQVDCYISRPTEKTLMLNFMLGVAALSLFLNGLDFICAIKRSLRQKSKVRECIYEDEHAIMTDPDPNSSFSRVPETKAGQKGSFRKRQGSRSSCKIMAQEIGQDTASEPRPLVPMTRNNNGNNDYSASLEEAEALEKEGDKLVLCPLETAGNPKAVCVNKRRLKPPPPPRRDRVIHPGISTRPKKDETAVTGDCLRRIDQYALVSLGSGTELSNDEGQEKRSEWV
ncbi:gap junction delta-4 protein [Stigmatopora nigra]